MLDQEQAPKPRGEVVAGRPDARRPSPSTQPGETRGAATLLPPPPGDTPLQRALSDAVRRRADAGAGAYAPDAGLRARWPPPGPVVARRLLQRDPALIKRVQDRITDPARFELVYTANELDELIKKGRLLGFDDRTIEDLLFTGSRKAKAISAPELLIQMQNTVDVAARGFPYLFNSLVEFKTFSRELIDGVEAADISADDIRIQGSSLRKPTAGDVDIAVFVDEDEFAELLIERYHDRITLHGQKVSLTNKTHADLLLKAAEIVTAGKNANANARTFANAAQQGMISSKSDIIPKMKELARKLAQDYPHLNVESVSVLRLGGAFEMKPDMKVTR